MHRTFTQPLVGLAFLILSFTSLSAAQGAAEVDAEKAWTEARAAAKEGPQDVTLGEQATLGLPEGHIFVPQPQAGKVLQAMGNPGEDPRLQGIVFPKQGAWFMPIRFESAGYVKDDDAKDWNADDLLKSFREGTEASNAQRVKMGVPAIEVLGWVQKPAYDAATHRLAWAMSSRDKGAAADAKQGVNYNTYALGREGYFTMNLVTGLDQLATYQPAAHRLLDGLRFSEGKRYADFNAHTDKVAEYGLAALVVGVAAKKIGLFAVIAAFLAKFAKVILLALAGFGGTVFKLFGRKPKTVVQTPAPVSLSKDQDPGAPPAA